MKKSLPVNFTFSDINLILMIHAFSFISRERGQSQVHLWFLSFFQHWTTPVKNKWSCIIYINGIVLRLYDDH